MMCVSHGEALEKTKIRMSIKHQHSLERMRHTVQGLSFPPDLNQVDKPRLTNPPDLNLTPAKLLA